MSDVKRIATRESYGEELVRLGAEHEEIVVLDADLAEATRSGEFQKVFPDRFIDCGIAEENMMGVAAGLAAAGKVPFASSFAMFAVGRAYEQIRNSIGYPHLNVKIGASHAGISVGEDGATHQCIEDIALMRMIPGMVVINPSDYIEAKAAVRAAYEHDGPVYMRFGRLAVPLLNTDPDYKFELGKGVVLREGKDLTIIASGLPVYNCLEAAERLAQDGIDGLADLGDVVPDDGDDRDFHTVLQINDKCSKHITRKFFFNRISGIFRKMRFPPPLLLCPAGRDLCVTRKSCYIMESENQE